MQHDYYAFQYARLFNILHGLEQADKELSGAKKEKNKEKQKKINGKIERISNDAIEIDPHLAYLWLKKERKFKHLENYIRDAWQKKLECSAIPEELCFIPDNSIIGKMPSLSFMIRICFSLRKPYISKDDNEFYLLDNPMRKEKIFQTPMVAGSGWKGALRSALWRLGHKENDKVTVRLFGNPRRSEKGKAGRLHFYPTFFENISLEVINPHDRKTGVSVLGPLLMECVPTGTTGVFNLMYVPFRSTRQNNNEQRQEVALDLRSVSEAIIKMLTAYGFGAKTSSGFGIVNDQLAKEGKLFIRTELDISAISRDSVDDTVKKSSYLDSDNKLHSDFLREDDSMISMDEYKVLMQAHDQQWGKRSEKRFNAAKDWYENKITESLKRQELESKCITEISFSSLTEMLEISTQVAEKLQEGCDV